MAKKIPITALILFVLLFCLMAAECFADASAQLEQAKAYDKNEKYEQAEVIYKTIILKLRGFTISFSAANPCEARNRYLLLPSGLLTSGTKENPDYPVAVD